MRRRFSSRVALVAVAAVLLAGFTVWLVWQPEEEQIVEEGTPGPSSATATPTSALPPPGRPLPTPTPVLPGSEVSREVDRWAVELLANTLGLEAERVALDESEGVVKLDYQIAAPFEDETALITTFSDVMMALSAADVPPDTVLPEATPSGLWVHALMTLSGQTGILSLFLPLEEPVISVVFTPINTASGTPSPAAVTPTAAAELAFARWVTPVLAVAFGEAQLKGVGYSVPGDARPHPEFVLTYDVPGVPTAHEDLEVLANLLREGLASQGVPPDEVRVEPTLTGFAVRAPVTASEIEGFATIQVDGGTTTVTVAYWPPGSAPP